jgi:hypothetical protein
MVMVVMVRRDRMWQSLLDLAVVEDQVALLEEAEAVAGMEET